MRTYLPCIAAMICVAGVSARDLARVATPDEFHGIPNLFFPRLQALDAWDVALLTAAAGAILLATASARAPRAAPRPPRAWRAAAAAVAGLLLAVPAAEAALTWWSDRYDDRLLWCLPNAGGHFFWRAGPDVRRYGFLPRAGMDFRGVSFQGFSWQAGRDAPGVRLPPIRLRTDEDGFRLPRVERPAIVVVGDSMTMGGEVDEDRPWPRLLERATGQPVANLAVAAQGTTVQVRILEDFGLPREPRIALLSFFPGNDIEDETVFQSFEKAGSTWTEMRFRCRVPPGARRIRFTLLAALLDPPAEAPWNHFEVARLPARCGAVHLYPTDRLRPLEDDAETWERSPGWPRAVTALQRFGSQCEERGIHRMVVFLPQKTRVLLDRILEAGPPEAVPPSLGPAEEFADRARRNRDALRDLVFGVCRDAGIPFLDLTEVMIRRAEEGKEDYLPYDHHFTEEGHVAVAGEVERALAERGWIGVPP